MSNRIVYSCPFVPSEWITAHGLTPSRVAPGGSNTTLTGQPPGVCPYALAFANEAASDKNAAAVVFTTACDQMRRVADLVTEKSQAPVFLMTVPHTWQTSTSRELYASELERLGTFMVRLGGTQPNREDLAHAMLEREKARESLANARQEMSPKQYSEFLMRFHKDRTIATGEAVSGLKSRNTGHTGHSSHPVNPVHPVSSLPIALVGGPLMSRDLDLFDMIEKAGGFVAIDATETGERTLPAAFDRKRMQDDPLGAMADAYFGHIPDPFRRPNNAFYNWLKLRVAQENVRGLILRRYVWCDIWHAEAERLKEQTGLPVLHLDVSDDGTDAARTQYRLQSFMEMLK